MRIIDADQLLEALKTEPQYLMEAPRSCKSLLTNIISNHHKKVIEVIEQQPTVDDVDKRDTQLELHIIKLLTLGAKAYATWFDIITSKMRGNDEIAKLFLELPTVQGTSNIMALERLKDSEIDVNSISSLEDVIKAIA